MAAKNPWNISPGLDSPENVQAGLAALKEGKLDPLDVIKVSKRHGIPLSPDYLSLAMGTSPQPKNELDMNGEAGPAGRAAQEAQALAGVKSPQGSATDSSSTTNSNSLQNMYKRTSNNRLVSRPEDVRAAEMMKREKFPEITGYEPARDPNTGIPIPGVYDDSRPNYNFDKVTEDFEGPVHQQEAGLNRLQDLMGIEAEANQGRSTMDWAPLAALADANNAQHGVQTNLIAGTRRPDDITGKFNAFADELQKRRADIQKGLGNNNSLLNGGSAQNIMSQIAALKQAEIDAQKDTAGFGGNGRGAIAQENAFLSRVSRESKELRTQDQVLGNVSRLLAQWNPTSDAEIKTQLARLVEGTVRPQLAVIGASGGDPSFLQQIENMATRITSGKLPVEQRGQYMQELKALATTHGEQANALKASWTVQNQRLSNPFSDMDLGKIMGTATPSAGVANRAMKGIAAPKNTGAPKKAPAAAAAGPLLSPTDWMKQKGYQ